MARTLSWQMTYLILVALQPQLLGSCLEVPDANGEVIGRRSQHISCQWVEAQRVDFLCVAWGGPLGDAEPLGSHSPPSPTSSSP
jgi:hypothetical protein